ncbi:uncharacterized protein [Haliotis asinina]|uniref:uncharacterized protein n=1 Tax=Haliotis asinina TaxID=109174 RepID=UPI003531EDCE
MLAIVFLFLFVASVSCQGGRPKPVNVTGPVFDAANFACNEINDQSNSEDWFTLLHAGNATTQVVTGEIFRMDLTMGESVCQNTPLNHNATPFDCPVPEGAMIWKYGVEVLFVHWQTPEFTLLDFHQETGHGY